MRYVIRYKQARRGWFTSPAVNDPDGDRGAVDLLLGELDVEELGHNSMIDYSIDFSIEIFKVLHIIRKLNKYTVDDSIF